MKTVKKYSSLIIFVIVVALDYKYNFLGKMLESTSLEDLIKLLGALLFAKTTKTDLTTSFFSKDSGKQKYNVSADDETDIGGGGIKNPKTGG